jgi:small subunit ribosomal protein S9
VTDAEHPEDEHRSQEQEAAEPQVDATPAADEAAAPAEQAPAAPDTEPVAEEPVAAPEPTPEPVAEAAPTPEPVAEVAPTPEPVAQAEPTPEPAAQAAPTAEPEPVSSESESAAVAPEAAPAAPAPEARADGEEVEEVELVPRQRPEIPGADLIPDIIPEGEEFLDAEARAAAEAEAEAAAQAEQEQDDEPKPIADAAIDLAAGARYTSTGKRKTAVARVILKPGSGTYSINSKALETFFPRATLQRIIRQPLETVGYESRMDVVATMHGGGVAAQAGALRHGISRALIVADPNLRGELKRRGFLTRDPRVKERKKAGLKKARKRPQFSKR